MLRFVFKCYTTNKDSRQLRFSNARGDYQSRRQGFNEEWLYKLSEKYMVDEHRVFLVSSLTEAEMRWVINKPTGESTCSKSVDQATSQAVKKKHRTWQRYLKTRDQENYRAYTKQRNKVRWTTRNRQEEGEKDISKCSESNGKKFCRYLRSKLKTRTGVADLEISDMNGARQIKEDGLKAEALSDYCGTVFTKEPEGDIPSLPRMS